MLNLKTNSLRLAENRTLVEQLRLIYENISVSFLPMFPAIFLLVWVLITPENRIGLLTWAIGLSLSLAYSIIDTRRILAHRLSEAEAPKLTQRLVVFMAVNGAAWGALAFGILGNTTAVGTIVVICILAGILGGTVGLLSPVLPVFIAFAVPTVGLTAAKMAELNDPAYSAFSIIAVMYLAVLMAQARNSSIATRTAIELRFENFVLMRQAEAARHEAEDANNAKSKFLAAASHDLRQPIHAQGLFLSVLSRTQLNPKQVELVNNISAASSASVEMLNTLLDFSRIDAGVVQPRKESFRIQHMLNKIEREFEPQADAKGLAYRSRETDLVVQSDPALVELILRNLVSNAIRYTERGAVLVACRKRGDFASLEVWDTGIGVAVDQQTEIFKEFHQLGNPERDRQNGLGLGLSIVQGLTRALGHKLSLHSRLQRGSVFKLALPVAQAFAVVQPILNENASTESTKSVLRGLQVLVIDDDEAVLSAMALLLESWGCQVASASSIEQALALAQDIRPDVLISDYRLRNQHTGAQAIQQIRQQLGETIPALIITGDTAPDRLREAHSSGIPLLHKPLSPTELYQTITKISSKTTST
ncbi:MAG: hybrid sensor histidine kinase/response regulator [Burkholderiaceae bacterium]